MMYASQEMIDRMTVAGEQVLAAGQALVEAYMPPEVSRQDRDRSIGRDLALALFLAARGDGVLNRIALIEGIEQAIGECCAQQPAPNAAAIVQARERGFGDGLTWGAATLGKAGEA